MKIQLAPWARNALWIGTGAFGGLAIGALFTSPARALGFAPWWFVLYAFFVLALGLASRRAPAEAPPSPARPAPVPVRAPTPAPIAKAPASTALHMRFAFPQVPRDFPAVLGEGEDILVALTVHGAAGPAEGAGVRLHAIGPDGKEEPAGEGVTGSDGTVEFEVPPQEKGEVRLRAEATHDELEAHAVASVSIVRYDEEIERLFGEFRAFATRILGRDAEAHTARELADRLRVGAKPEVSRALMDVARIYELVAYGERDADRRLYLALLKELIILENAEMPDARATAPAGG